MIFSFMLRSCICLCIFKAVMITVHEKQPALLTTKLHPRENLGFYKYSPLTPHLLQYYILFILFPVNSLIRGEESRGPDSMVWLSHESKIIRNLLRHFELLASKGRFICDSLCYCDDRHKLRLMRSQVPVIAKIIIIKKDGSINKVQKSTSTLTQKGGRRVGWGGVGGVDDLWCDVAFTLFEVRYKETPADTGQRERDKNQFISDNKVPSIICQLWIW